MTKLFATITISLLLTIGLGSFVYAQKNNETAPLQRIGTESVELPRNPLPFENFMEVIARFIVVFGVLIGSFATLMIIIGGGKMLASAGDETMYKDGLKTVQWAVIGVLVYLLTFSMVQVVRLLVK